MRAMQQVEQMREDGRVGMSAPTTAAIKLKNLWHRLCLSVGDNQKTG